MRGIRFALPEAAENGCHVTMGIERGSVMTLTPCPECPKSASLQLLKFCSATGHEDRTRMASLFFSLSARSLAFSSAAMAATKSKHRCPGRGITYTNTLTWVHTG